MKNKKMISANEINRFVYCPYQWYYTKVYGQKAIREKYKALPHQKSQHENNFTRGLKFHKRYYKQYRLKRLAGIAVAAVLAILAMIGGMQWLSL